MLKTILKFRKSMGESPIPQSNAKVAHLVEHDPSKVGVASSSLVFRSNGCVTWQRSTPHIFHNSEDSSRHLPYHQHKGDDEELQDITARGRRRKSFALPRMQPKIV